MNKVIQLLKGQVALWTTSRNYDYDTWIFSSTNNENFNYNSKYLFLYVKEHFPKVKPYFVINDKKTRGELSKQYGEEYFIETKTVAGMRRVIRAGVWLTSAGLPVYALGSGKRHIIINLWHGVPLKKIALLEENRSWIRKLYFKKVFSDNYSCILTTSEELVDVMAASFNVKRDRIKVWGQPRNDEILKSITTEKKLRELYHELPFYKKAVLYAPTYREDGSTKLFPFPDMDKKKLVEYLEREQILLCMRTHIEEKGNCTAFFSERILNIGTDIIDDITEYLSQFDLLITDYSSIYIDYLLLDRPMIFLPYDKEKYLKIRGMNFDYEEVTPGDKPQNLKEFLEAIQSALYNDKYKEQREKVNHKFNEVRSLCSNDICEKIYKMEEKKHEKSNNLRNI